MPNYEKDRIGIAKEHFNGVNFFVRKGVTHLSDGSLKTPTLHVSAKVQISYMDKETKKGAKGDKKHFSKMAVSAAEAKRRMKREVKRKEKMKRREEAEGGGGVKELGGFTVKSAAGRGKDPLVLEVTQMNASGLKAGGAG
jgi:hypothetical protein